jgi:hypothetical protein
MKRISMTKAIYLQYVNITAACMLCNACVNNRPRDCRILVVANKPPPWPIVHFAKQHSQSSTLALLLQIYFPSHMGLAIIAKLIKSETVALHDPVCASPGCLENDAVVFQPLDASISPGS